MDAAAQHDVTGLLKSWARGDPAAFDRLVPLVHDQLQRLAHQSMRREHAGHTLQTTALVNEAYLRLVDARSVQSDIWALTVMAYECLTGVLPFPTGQRDAWRGAVLSGRYTPLEEPLAEVPERWTAFFADGLAVERERRPQTVAGFFTRLEEALG